jgi:hypothetical protein
MKTGVNMRYLLFIYFYVRKMDPYKFINPSSSLIPCVNLVIHDDIIMTSQATPLLPPFIIHSDDGDN